MCCSDEFEINEAAALVSQAAHAEANIIFGAVIDDALGDEVRVTVIAAGFDGGTPKRRDTSQPALRRESAPVRPAVKSEPESAPRPNGTNGTNGSKVDAERPLAPVSASPRQPSGSPGSPSSAPSRPAPAREPRPVKFDDDELDVPDFLK